MSKNFARSAWPASHSSATCRQKRGCAPASPVKRLSQSAPSLISLPDTSPTTPPYFEKNIWRTKNKSQLRLSLEIRCSDFTFSEIPCASNQFVAVFSCLQTILYWLPARYLAFIQL